MAYYIASNSPFGDTYAVPYISGNIRGDYICVYADRDEAERDALYLTNSIPDLRHGFGVVDIKLMPVKFCKYPRKKKSIWA